MINLYYDKNLRIEAKTYQLFPLLEKLEEQNSSLLDFYNIVDSIEDCDLGIIPMNIQLLILRKKQKEVKGFIEKCKQQAKNVLVFSGGDFGHTINTRGVYTIRLGGFHSKLNKCTFIMPPFIDDPYSVLDGKFDTLSKSRKPEIGFVGHANGSNAKMVKEYLSYVKGILNRLLRKDVSDSQSFYPSSLKRYTYLNGLLNKKDIEADFVFRDQYRAGIKTEQDKAITTREFYQNMNDNLYTFCSRGTGNFSVRFYETLAMGRIPVLIDTDCRLPFPEQIDWNNHCVIIPEKEVGSIEQLLIDFHSKKSEDDLIKIQEENRMIWQKYFTKSTYFIELADELKNIKNTV